MPRSLSSRALAAIATLTLLLGACDQPAPERTPPRSQTTSPATTQCPAFDDPQRVGSVRSSGLDEISGAVASERHDVLWVHEDSGADPVVHAITPEGRPVASVTLAGANHTDWEDIALADGTLWIGDIGDNPGIRVTGIQVYWLREPDPRTGTVNANVLSLTYEDGPHDAEALIVDARHDALFVITKELSLTRGTVYRTSIDGLRDEDLRELQRIGTVPLGIVTAADLSEDGVIVKSYGKARLFPWTDDRTVGSAIHGDACPVPLGGGESVAYRAADDRYYSIPEGANPPVWVTARS